ncbi:hypothetical protein GCM10010166_37200 [Couchioplanes caeruleus subsp. azureus]|nr:hypothetical protein GCM10010166_37200 [Couchioplanes caeruleus subsp. azureus]
MRRAYTALASWYAVVWLLPGVLVMIVNMSAAGRTPGFTEVQGRVTPCAGDFGCPTEPMDAGAVVLGMAPGLAASLLVAVPLCRHLTRTWQMPVLAGSVAAVTSWMILCLGLWVAGVAWAG